MAYQIQLRSDTAANWTAADPVLGQGEIGIETDTNTLKIGDGATAWTALAYFGGSAGGALLAANNLSDVADPDAALDNLGGQRHIAGTPVSGLVATLVGSSAQWEKVPFSFDAVFHLPGALAAGASAFQFPVPALWQGKNLVDLRWRLGTPGTTGTTFVIEQSPTGAFTASEDSQVITAAAGDANGSAGTITGALTLATDDALRINVTSAGTGAADLVVVAVFQ